MPATTSERKDRCPDRGVMSHVALSMLPTLPRAGCKSFIATVLLFGCGGGGDGDAAAPDAAVPVAQADAAPDAGVADQAAAFCRAQAQAKCAWAFACESLSAGDRAGVLGLGGADEAACTENAAATCIADTADRAARGTLNLQLDKQDDCLSGLRVAPCQDTDPVDWVRAWREFTHERCARVLAGNVDVGGACETQRDCVVTSNLCVNGACAAGEKRDITRDCEASGQFEGQVNRDAACPGEACVQVGRNGNDKTGMCTVDCGDDAGDCPDGTACVQAVPQGGPASFYCTQPCEESGAPCPNGFECVRINASGLDTSRHCWVTAP